MFDSFKLLEPIKNRVREIEEELTEHTSKIVDGEIFNYGSFISTFEGFYNDNKRKGKEVNEIDYFNSKIYELQSLKDSVFELEKKIDEDKGNSIKFHAILTEIIDTIRKAEALKKSFFVRNSKTVIKNRNYRNKLTYKWNIEYHKINELHRLLIKNEMIAKKTKYSDFEMVFKENPVSKIKNPIKWSSSNATELLYFIVQINYYSIVEKNKRLDYERLKSGFVKSNEEKFSENFNSIKQQIQTKLSLSKQSQIDKIIRTIIN